MKLFYNCISSYKVKSTKVWKCLLFYALVHHCQLTFFMAVRIAPCSTLQHIRHGHRTIRQLQVKETAATMCKSKNLRYYNGGKCLQRTAQCLCPIGFNGTSCEKSMWKTSWKYSMLHIVLGLWLLNTHGATSCLLNVLLICIYCPWAINLQWTPKLASIIGFYIAIYCFRVVELFDHQQCFVDFVVCMTFVELSAVIPKFSGNSYLAVDIPPSSLTKRFTMEITFIARSATGLLMYIGGQDYMSVSLVNGVVIYR